MSENFGSGIYLDEDFDFSVDETGDTRSTSGTNELEKDLSVNLAITLDQFIGAPLTGNTETKASDRTIRTVLADDRVRNVVNDSVSVSSDENLRKIDVELSVITNSGEEQELVFTI